MSILAVFGSVSCQSAAQDPDPSVGSGDGRVAAEKIAEAETLYAQRQDLAKVRLAIAHLRQARIADYGSYEAAWKLARASYYLGAHTDDDRERDDAFREGIEAGRVAVRLQGNRAEGHFWLGANYGGSAEHSTLAGLANVEDIKREMEAVLKIDEGFQAGSAYMALGQVYMQAPRLLGGDPTKAIQYLEKGLKFGPDNAMLRLRLAEAYQAVRRVAEAWKQIETLMTMTPNPDYVAEHREATEKAKKLLEKMN